MDIPNAIFLFLIMVALAALPSASVALVVTRSATHGVPNGIAVASGIVIGDLVFVTLALLGMSAIAETMGAFFAVLKYVGGAYLIWLGYSLMTSTSALGELKTSSNNSSLIGSVLAGLALTLGDLKAILFYASLFPNLFTMSALTMLDVSLIVAVTVVAVGGVKVLYAIVARRIVERFHKRTISRSAQTTAGGILIGTGAYVIAKA